MKIIVETAIVSAVLGLLIGIAPGLLPREVSQSPATHWSTVSGPFFLAPTVVPAASRAVMPMLLPSLIRRPLPTVAQRAARRQVTRLLHCSASPPAQLTRSLYSCARDRRTRLLSRPTTQASSPVGQPRSYREARNSVSGHASVWATVPGSVPLTHFIWKTTDFLMWIQSNARDAASASMHALRTSSPGSRAPGKGPCPCVPTGIP